MQPSELTQHYSWLINQAKLFTSHDYEDLAHDTYLRAVRYLPSFQEGSNLKGWLYTIMHSIFINKFRNVMQYNDVLNDHVATPSDMYACMELIQVKRDLKQMTTSKGEALLLYVEGYEYKEISLLTGINPGTIKSRINSARKVLREVHRNDR